jgi:hypothetical protein
VLPYIEVAHRIAQLSAVTLATQAGGQAVEAVGRIILRWCTE